MLELLAQPQAWLALITLSILEIVLGIDNVIFIIVVAKRLPAHQVAFARRLGLLLALIGRIGLLLTLVYVHKLTITVVQFGDWLVTWRDVVLFVGGVFLVVKAAKEICLLRERE